MNKNLRMKLSNVKDTENIRDFWLKKLHKLIVNPRMEIYLLQ